MSDITLSILGIYNQQLRDDDQHTFLSPDVMQLPESFETADRQALAHIILLEGAELEAVYPDGRTMNTIVAAWSRARLPSWERMITALDEEYNPLHNYDRTEIATDTDTGTRTIADTGTVTNADTGTVNDTTGSTVTGQVTGFNSNSFADDKKTTSSGTVGSTRNLQNQETRNTQNLETRNLTSGHQLRAYGNIGVTTSAQMLEGELDVRKTDIYRIIADEFIRYFCIMVY